MEIFSFDEIPGLLRKIARKDYWQSLYSLAKEGVSGIQMLENTRNFTFYQMLFLNNLSFYASLYQDIVMGEVSDRVMENEIYQDAYYYYRTEKRLAKTKRANTFADGEHGTVVKQVNDYKEEITNKNLWNFTKVKNT